jgi:hypothetical protein
MATQAAVLPNSESETSGNFGLIEQVRMSSLHPTRREVIAAMLEYGNRFAEARENNSNEMFQALLRIAIAVGRSYATVRRHVKAAREVDKVLVQTRSSNVHVKCGYCAGYGTTHKQETCEKCKGDGYVLRRPCSYQLDLSKLKPRMTLAEFDKVRPHRSAKKFRAKAPARKPKRSTPPSPAAPVVEIPPYQPTKRELLSTGHVNLYREQLAAEKLHEMRLKLMTRFGELKRGGTRADGLYFRPMEWNVALLRAAQDCGMTVEEAHEHLKVMKVKLSDESPEGP